MAGHISSRDLLNNSHVQNSGAVTLSGLFSSTIKRTNGTVASSGSLRYVVKLNILPKYNSTKFY
jgi:hypothetical protein